MKICKKCGYEFSMDRCPNCKKIYNAIYHAKDYKLNKEKIKSNVSKYYSENTEKVKAYAAKYRLENKEKVYARTREWILKNPISAKSIQAAYRLRNPEKIKLSMKKHAAKKPESFVLARQNRRARKRNLGGKLSKGLSKDLFIKQRGKCACCGEHLEAGYHLDHIMPLALGGLNIDNNIQLLNPKCNFKKNAKHPIDYMQMKGFLL